MRGPLSARIKSQKGTSALALAYRELEAVFQKNPITVSQFDVLLSQPASSIATIYSSLSDADRNVTEREMLVKGEIPAVLYRPVRELLTVTAKTLKEEVNVAELYFTNIGWLGLTDDQSSKSWRMQHRLDAMRKIELKKDKPIKRCTRCGSVSEDAQPQRGTSFITMALQRHCFCGGWWHGVGEEEAMGNTFS